MCKIVIIGIWLITFFVRQFMLENNMLILIGIIGGIWIWLYLTGLKIEVSYNSVTKYAGSIFKQISIINLKNIFYIQIIKVNESMPAIIRMQSAGKTLIVLGLDGRQAEYVEKYIRKIIDR